jgi:hypothetical protein
MEDPLKVERDDPGHLFLLFPIEEIYETILPSFKT